MGAVRSVRGAVEEHKQTLQEAMVHDKMVREYSIRLHYLIYATVAYQAELSPMLGLRAACDSAVQ
jgi:hypothetical protein